MHLQRPVPAVANRVGEFNVSADLETNLPAGLSVLEAGVGEEIRLAHLSGRAHVPHPQRRGRVDGQRVAVHRQGDDLSIFRESKGKAIVGGDGEGL